MLRVGVIRVNNIGRSHAATYRDNSLSDVVARFDIGEMRTAISADTTLYAEGGPTRRTWQGLSVSASTNSAATAATLVATYESARGPRVILTRRPTTLRRHPGQVAFPGGMIESTDPTPFAAATREAWEEIRLRVPASVVPLPLSPVMTLSSGIIIQPYWVRLPGWPRATAAPAEVEAILRVPIRDLAESTSLRSFPHPRRPDEQTPAYTWHGEVIWGATLTTLRELVSLVGHVSPAER